MLKGLKAYEDRVLLGKIWHGYPCLWGWHSLEFVLLHVEAMHVAWYLGKT
jgi:hypothetical protein